MRAPPHWLCQPRPISFWYPKGKIALFLLKMWCLTGCRWHGDVLPWLTLTGLIELPSFWKAESSHMGSLLPDTGQCRKSPVRDSCTTVWFQTLKGQQGDWPWIAEEILHLYLMERAGEKAMARRISGSKISGWIFYCRRGIWCSQSMDVSCGPHHWCFLLFRLC